jgi:hypothetical protein
LLFVGKRNKRPSLRLAVAEILCERYKRAGILNAPRLILKLCALVREAALLSVDAEIDDVRGKVLRIRDRSPFWICSSPGSSNATTNAA